MNAVKQLLGRMNSHNTLLCAGLDPDLTKIPREIIEEYKTNEERVLEFIKAVITISGPHVCAYKAQKAFFDLLPGGHEVLKECVSYIHKTQPGLPVIIDCKIGDIDNTMNAYIENLFGKLNADGIVVNPYMGSEVIEPLINLDDKIIVVLVKTSNIGGAIIQDVIVGRNIPLWQYILDILINRWNINNNMVPVIASTANLNLLNLRLSIPWSMPILFAGVGAQGGSYSEISQLLNSDGIGVFVNSSRGILYPQEGSSYWLTNIKEAVISTKDNLNKARLL